MKAMILAAGLGTRLLPVTRTTPKILLPLLGVTMLERLLAGLAQGGVREAALNTHHLAEAVRRHVALLEGRGRMPMPLRLFHEPALLGTGGALVNIRDFWGPSPLLLWNGDVLADLELEALAAAHSESGALATLVTQGREERAHLLVDEEGRVCGVEGASRGGRRLVAEPRGGAEKEAFNGISLLAPGLLERIGRAGPFDLIDALLDAIAQGGAVRAHRMEGFWGTTGAPEEVAALEAGLAAHPDLLARFTPRGG